MNHQNIFQIPIEPVHCIGVAEIRNTQSLDHGKFKHVE